MRRRTLLLAALASLLTGCLANDTAAPRARVSQGVSLELPPPAAFGQSLRAVQFVLARHGGESVAFEAHLEITDRRLTMIGLDAAGRRIVTIDWNGMTLAQSASRLPAQVRPENLLADLMLAYFPLRHLKLEADAGLAAELLDSPGRRVLLVNGRERMLISFPAQGERWDGKVLVENRSFGYEIEIHSSLVRP